MLGILAVTMFSIANAQVEVQRLKNQAKELREKAREEAKVLLEITKEFKKANYRR